ncbi:hypothetical protein vBPFY1MI_148 [Pseudomonas phage vB_PF_Y1-MI]|nr:hypothetical protein vBPFY1MI_148 [Pseudomonas phage vB_PF_Y1-MI]
MNIPTPMRLRACQRVKLNWRLRKRLPLITILAVEVGMIPWHEVFTE